MDSLFDQGPPPACPAPFNLAAYVLAQADAAPDKTALSVVTLTGSEDWSYARLRAAVQGCGAGMLAAGAVPGDRVLMRLGNTVDFPLAFLGAIAVGLVPIPTAAQLTEPEVAAIIAETGPRLILHEAGVPCPAHPGRIAHAAFGTFRDLPPALFAMGDPDRLAYILYTSGTSGQPRAVCHAHRAIWARRMMWQGWYDLRPGDRLLHAGVFNWSFTLGTGLLDPWAIGATALIPAASDPAQLPLLLARHRATIFAAAPGVYRRVLAAGPLPALPHLRHGLTAGEKLPASLQDAWEAATGTGLHEAYGMSECSTFISANPDAPAHGSLGRPQPGRRVAIVDAGGTPVPVGTPGAIALSRRDPGLMLGYLGQPAETAARMRGEWFVTGDTGWMDDRYHIGYLGRDDDMMNAGGFRVSPIEVEHRLSAHPDIAEVAVTEVQVRPDVTVIAAFYVAERDLDSAALSRFAARGLARYKQPRLYRRVPALPRGANNKILRKRLRQEFEVSDDQA